MIRRIEAQNFRCLRSVSQRLHGFEILVGANASGKSSFLDVVAFLGDLLREGLEEAVTRRTEHTRDLIFQHGEGPFTLAVEMDVPVDRQSDARFDRFPGIRYEVSIGVDAERQTPVIAAESVWLLNDPAVDGEATPSPGSPPNRQTRRFVLGRMEDGADRYAQETGHGRDWRVRLGPTKSALANLPDDETDFPATTWMRRRLREGTAAVDLETRALREPGRRSPRGPFDPSGAGLAWAVEALRLEDPAAYDEWIRHVRTALPEVEGLSSVEIPHLRQRFLEVRYGGGLVLPSWAVSDGTLRLLALTLPAWFRAFDGAYLIEEPEKGIHPLGLETVYQALRSVYEAQVLVTTHSPVLLGCADPAELLCFRKGERGGSRVTRGSEDPLLESWRGSMSLGDLFASGVLG